MSTRVHVLGISGSLRRQSMNTATLRAAGEMLPESMTLETFDIAPLPMYNWDDEAQGDPEPVIELKQRIIAADALLLVTPEYNYSITGALKNALDWASRPLRPGRTMPTSGKPLAIMGAGGRFGTVRAQHHLRQIAVEMGMLTLGKPEVQIMRPRDKFDADLRLTDDATREEIRALLVALELWVRRLRGE